MTPEEMHLWCDFFKLLPITVHRQKVIGNYIVDFYIAKEKLVIELDGSQHYEPENLQKDQARDAYLKSRNITVLRYKNNDINENFKSVCADIINYIPRLKGYFDY